MKVKDAIEALKKLDPEAEIMVCDDAIEFGTFSPLDGFQVAHFYKGSTLYIKDTYFEATSGSDMKRKDLEQKIAVRF
jgi:hypothetical protein